MNSTSDCDSSKLMDPGFVALKFALFTCLQPIICLCGLATNTVNIIVFSSAELKEDIFVYFLALSVSDQLYIFNTFISWAVGDIFKVSYTHSYSGAFYLYFIYTAVLISFSTVSSLIQIVISLDQLLIMSKNACLLKLPKLPPKHVLALICGGSAFVCLMFILMGEVRLCKADLTYQYGLNQFGQSPAGASLYVVFIILKSIVVILVLLAINLVLGVEVKRFYDRKKCLLPNAAKASHEPDSTSQHTPPHKESRPNRQASLSHKAKFARMTVIMFGLYFIGNIGYAVVGMLKAFFNQELFAEFLLVVSVTLIYFPATFNMIIYYKFNSRFRAIFHKKFRKNNSVAAS